MSDVLDRLVDMNEPDLRIRAGAVLLPLEVTPGPPPPPPVLRIVTSSEDPCRPGKRIVRDITPREPLLRPVVAPPSDPDVQPIKPFPGETHAAFIARLHRRLDLVEARLTSSSSLKGSPMKSIPSRASFAREQPEAAAQMDRIFRNKPAGPSIMRHANGRITASHVRAASGQSEQDGPKILDPKALLVGLRAVVGSGRDVRPALRQFINEIEQSAQARVA